MRRIFSKFFKSSRKPRDGSISSDHIDLAHRVWSHRILEARKAFYLRHHKLPKYLALTPDEEHVFRTVLYRVWDTDETWFGRIPKDWKPMSASSRYLGLEIVNFEDDGIDWDRAIDLIGV